MAGVAGFEPTNAGVKVPCLTAWRHPIVSPARCYGKRAGTLRLSFLFLGWVKGLEPSTPGTTIRCSNQLSYTHQIMWNEGKLARLKGLEPLTHCLEGSCSIQLSYRRVSMVPVLAGSRTDAIHLQNRHRTLPALQMERVMGIEPTRPAWKAGILPLNYTRIGSSFRNRQLL